MRVRGNSGLAVILIIVGALILFSKIHLFGFAHHLMGYIFPIIIIGLGYMGIRYGRWLIGGVLLFFGILMLIGKLAGLIGFIIAVVMIGYGISMLSKKSRNSKGYRQRMHDES